MTRWIVERSMRFRVLVVPVAAALMVAGITQLRGAPALIALAAFLRQRRAVAIGAVALPLPLGAGRSTGGAIAEASLQIRRPAGYATLIVLLVMVPGFFTGDLTGSFLHPLGLGYGLAVLASPAAALTVTPAVACARSAAFDNEAATDEGASRLVRAEDTDLVQVVLPARAAPRIGVRTASIRRAGAGGARMTMRAEAGRSCIRASGVRRCRPSPHAAGSREGLGE